jgi:A/G-specific adenine glycosylase
MVIDALLAWYRRDARDLPWRRYPGDPYRVWVSEIMLQQTRVETVIPYYQRFLEVFPTVERLADASSDEVMRYWQGLGYYRRGHLLHEGAQWLVRERGGEFPESREVWGQVPGVGSYTAGALASICNGESVGAVDGNVRRVFSRWFAWGYPLDRGSGFRRAQRAARLMAHWSGDPGSWNQALMELGARVCRSRQPLCGACPVQRACRAHRAGRVEEYPVLKKKPPVPELDEWVWVLQAGHRWFVRRRPAGGLWGGLWEFPCFSANAPEKWMDAWSLYQAETGGAAVILNVLEGKPFSHRLTHRLFTFHPVHLRLEDGIDERWNPESWIEGWDALANLPMSVPQQRIRAWVASVKA